ncbi:general transcription factor II-I repeat domain-containing protein 2-like, partial [Centruroides sculpturatus]|uniref:general transcription factor II-I repeat domain-containing protein 2-like n=1 Tax=Centruroides sculpturatus TaxID=218467 RepID=UPI000C6E9A6E
QNQLQESATEASLLVAKQIAQCGRPFAEREFVKKCMLDVCDVMCPEAKHKFENISLSWQTIARRIEDMNTNLNEQLLNDLESVHFYSIALDKSCDVKDTAQLLIFIRANIEDFQISEELLSIVPMKDTTKGDLFRKIEECILKYSIDWKKLVNVTTDGSPSMIGKNIGLIKQIEDKISEIDPNHKIIPTHCIIHCKNVLKINHIVELVLGKQNGIAASYQTSNNSQHENTSEFTIFPPLSAVVMQPSNLSDDKVTFEPLPEILSRSSTVSHDSQLLRVAKFTGSFGKGLDDWF